MDRRNFIKSLMAVPFIPSIDWGGSKPYFQYYFGPFGSGKTTRLVSDAIEFLEKYPVKGLYLLPGSSGIDKVVHILYKILPNIRPTLQPLSHQQDEPQYHLNSNILKLPSGGTFELGTLGVTKIDSSYEAFWSDQLDVQATNNTIHEQHVISTQAAIMIQEELGLKPVELGNGLGGFFSK